MVDFAVHGLPLRSLGLKVLAASVDSIDTTAKLKEGLHVGFPMFAEVDALALAEATGAHTYDRNGVDTAHATAFLVDPEGIVNNAVYSTGPIGRFTASEVIRKTMFEQAQRA
ncbi:MAG: redoxin domain-containing protein [Acidimicrobiia bacterium]|nr:redoxin domain-containing protein [Acidimicrobiia bacterium]